MKILGAAVSCALALSAGVASAGEFSLNGVTFNTLALTAQNREYRGEKFNACSLSLSLARTGWFAGMIKNRAGTKATCRDVPIAAVAQFVGTANPAYAKLLRGLGKAAWKPEAPQDLKKSRIYCELFIDKVPPTGPLDMACYGATLAGPFQR